MIRLLFRPIDKWPGGATWPAVDQFRQPRKAQARLEVER